MSTLDEIAETLQQQLKQSQKKIDGLKKVSGDKRFEDANKYQKQLNRIKNLLQTYDFRIKDTLQDGAQIHQSQYQQFSKKYKQLEKQLQYSRNQNADQQDLFKHRKGEAGTGKTGMTQKQQMIQKGHDIQAEGLQALKRAQKNVYEMDNMADNINVELDRQIQQLDNIYDNMKDTNTTLKRAQKHIRYFARQVYTDKLMMCLIVLIVIAIIVIIVLKIVGKTPQLSIDDIQ